MRNYSIFFKIIGYFFFTSVLTAQYSSQVYKNESYLDNQKPIAIDARPFLELADKVNGIDVRQIWEETKSLKKSAKSSWQFSIGTPYKWWALNSNPNSSDYNKFYQVNSTCRAIGEKCYIFVEDNFWGNKVTQEAVDAIKNAFEKTTPANPNKGIYDNDVEAFGEPPDVDNDPKVIILILDIQDIYSSGSSSFFIAGYFHSVNESMTYSYSNRAEIYYLDCNPLNLLTNNSIGLQTLAHEFQHMINFNYNKNADTFNNESMSMLAEVINGYPLNNQNYYNNETNIYLFNWRPSDDPNVLNDYSRAARFSLYYYEQFGNRYSRGNVQSPLQGVNRINAGISNAGVIDRNFSSILEDWFIANYINNISLNNGKWGYQNSRATKVNSKIHLNPNVNEATDLIYKYGAIYITYKNSKNLNFIFNNKSNSSIRAKVIKIGNSNIEVESISSGIEYSFSDLGKTYSEITFIFYITDQNLLGTGPYSFSYSSSGETLASAMEIKYDETEPTGYLQLTPGDSVAVVFDAVPGMKLDSIKVALRGTVPLQGRVLETLGTGSQLGGKLLANITATSSLSAPPAVVNPGAEYPYQIPYPNWVKVDLRSFNLTADKSFVVEFPIGAAYPASNRVLSTYYASDASYHSFSYQSANSRWVYYSVSGKDGFIFLFLIRAYVSSPGTGIEGPIEVLPSAYSLEQNYPNPFNPETIISYNLPKQSRVQIKIYDITGNEIRSLIDEEKSAGKHNILWDSRNNFGQRVSSGIYFYKIVADNFIETKKMVLMK